MPRHLGRRELKDPCPLSHSGVWDAGCTQALQLGAILVQRQLNELEGGQACGNEEIVLPLSYHVGYALRRSCTTTSFPSGCCSEKRTRLHLVAAHVPAAIQLMQSAPPTFSVRGEELLQGAPPHKHVQVRAVQSQHQNFLRAHRGLHTGGITSL